MFLVTFVTFVVGRGRPPRPFQGTRRSLWPLCPLCPLWWAVVVAYVASSDFRMIRLSTMPQVLDAVMYRHSPAGIV